MSASTPRPTIKSRKTASQHNQHPSSAHSSSSTSSPKEGMFSQVKQSANSALGDGHVIRYGLLGFIIAALILFVGLAPTIFLVLFALIGMAIGRYVDGDTKIRSLAHKASESLRG